MPTKISLNEMHINHYVGETPEKIQGPIIPFLYPRDYDPDNEAYQNEKAYGDKMKMGNVLFFNQDNNEKIITHIDMEIDTRADGTVPDEFVQLYEDYKKGHKIRITIESLEEKFEGDNIIDWNDPKVKSKIVNDHRWDK